MARRKMGDAQALPFFVRLLNPAIRRLLRIGVPMGPMTLLKVRGRKTGRPRTTPVGLFERHGRFYVFGTFGEVDWVQNLREAGEATLIRGRRKQQVLAAELTPEEAAPVLHDVLTPYLSSRIGRSFLSMGYELPPDASMGDFLAEARRHPGFELRPKIRGPTTTTAMNQRDSDVTTTVSLGM